MTNPQPTPADQVDKLPDDFDALTFAEKVSVQAGNGAKIVRVFRIEDDGIETQLFPEYPAAAFDTAHVARDHGAGAYKGLIIAPRGRRMAGTDTFRVHEAPSAKPQTAQGNDANTAQLMTALAALREELAQVKEAAGKRRTIADMTLDELRASIQPPPAAPASGFTLDKILAALPVIVPLINHFKPKSNVQEIAALMDLGDRVRRGGSGAAPAADSESEALMKILDHPVVTGLASRFMREPAAPGQPTPPRVTSPAAAALPQPAPAPAAPARPVASPEPEAKPVPAMPDDLRMIVAVAAKKIADELDTAPKTTADEAAAVALNDTDIVLVRGLLARFEPGALAMTMQAIEPRFKERLVWLTMLEGALRLAARPDEPDEDTDEPSADGGPGAQPGGKE